MNAAELLGNLSGRGVRLTLHGGRLRVEAPAGAVTPQDRAALAAHKPELVRLLAVEAGGFWTEGDDLQFGDLPRGWTPESWAARLRYLAAACHVDHPEDAERYVAWAQNVEARLHVQNADDLPPDWHEAYEERAGIMEFDAGLPRPEAEARALADVQKSMQAAAVGDYRRRVLGAMTDWRKKNPG